MIEVDLDEDGELPAAKGTLYTVPAATSAICRGQILVNNGAGINLVNLYRKRASGTSKRITPKDLSLEAGAIYEGDQIITMRTGDTIEGDATNAAEVEYTLTGVQRA